MIAKKKGFYKAAKQLYERQVPSPFVGTQCLLLVTHHVKRALSIVQKTYGDEHPKCAMYMHNLGVVYRKLKQHKESFDFYSKARTINEKLLGSRHPLVAGNLNGYILEISKPLL
jgi:tetratricopeptide (TPR) repeat protein